MFNRDLADDRLVGLEQRRFKQEGLHMASRLAVVLVGIFPVMWGLRFLHAKYSHIAPWAKFAVGAVVVSISLAAFVMLFRSARRHDRAMLRGAVEGLVYLVAIATFVFIFDTF